MEEYGNDNSPRAADTKVLITFKIMSNSWLGASRRWEDWCRGGDCQGCTERRGTFQKGAIENVAIEWKISSYR